MNSSPPTNMAEEPKIVTPTTSQLVKYASPDLLDPHALQPQSLGELEDVARMVVDSRMYSHLDTVPKAMLVIAEARERRVPYATALRASVFVKGKLTWYAYFLVGLVLREKQVCEYFEICETTMVKAVTRLKRVGRPEILFPYEIEEAKQAGWVRSGEKGDSKWITNPRVMLRWASQREAARAFFPDVVGGMYTPDEVRGGHITDAEFEVSETGEVLS